MAQDLADRDQARALAQQLTGQRMAQPVRADVRQARPQAGPFHDVADEVGPDRSARCSTGQEQVPSSGGLRPPGQVGDHRLTDLGRQRETILPTSLAAHDEFAGPPVHVAQLAAARPRWTATPAARSA